MSRGRREYGQANRETVRKRSARFAIAPLWRKVTETLLLSKEKLGT
jgi:hypothetical protein